MYPPNVRPSSWKIFFGWLLVSAMVGLIVLLPNVNRTHPSIYVWPKNLTRNVSELIRPGVTTMIMAPSYLSSPDFQTNPIDILVIICSAVKNFQQRNVIRQTWASPDVTPEGVKTLFLLGKTHNQTFQSDILSESAEYGDLVQEDFLDDYSNLTIKSLMMLKLFHTNCRSVPYLLKTDDDMFINLRSLKKMTDVNNNKALLTGSLICGARAIRDPTNKWFAPIYMYAPKIYPNYVSGTAYLMSNTVANQLYNASLSTQVFHLEDIFVTGILAKQVGVRPQDNLQFSYLKRRMSPCLYSQIISSHHLSSKEMQTMSKVLSQQKKCKILRKPQLRTYPLSKCRWQ